MAGWMAGWTVVCIYVCMCFFYVCARACACVRACMRARVCVCVCVQLKSNWILRTSESATVVHSFLLKKHTFLKEKKVEKT